MKTLEIVLGPPSKQAISHEKALFFNHLHFPDGVYHSASCHYKTWKERESALFSELVSNDYQLIYELFREAQYECEIISAQEKWGIVNSKGLNPYLCIALKVIEPDYNPEISTENYSKIYQVAESKYSRKWARLYTSN